MPPQRRGPSWIVKRRLDEVYGGYTGSNSRIRHWVVDNSKTNETGWRTHIHQYHKVEAVRTDLHPQVVSLQRIQQAFSKPFVDSGD